MTAGRNGVSSSLFRSLALLSTLIHLAVLLHCSSPTTPLHGMLRRIAILAPAPAELVPDHRVRVYRQLKPCSYTHGGYRPRQTGQYQD